MRKKQDRKSSKKLTVYFFRGHYTDNSNDSTPIVEYEKWIAIFQAINNTPVDIDRHYAELPSRYININGNIYFLLFYNSVKKELQTDFYDDKNNIVCGVILKRREANWPMIENGQGILREINTRNTNDSIAESAYFALDIKNSLLIFAGNQRSATSSTLAKYFSDIINAEIEKDNAENIETRISINFHFIERPDAEMALERMNFVKRIDIQLSGGDLLDSLNNNNPASTVEEAIAASIKAAKSFGGKTISLSLVVNTAQEISIIKRCVKKIQESIMPFKIKKETRPDKSQNKCSITGIVDEESRVLNLLDDKLIVKTDIEINGKYGHTCDIFAKLDECYQAEKALLLQIIANERSENK